MIKEKNMKLTNLELIRTERKLTRKDLAKLSGVNEYTIQALEEGRYDDIKLSTLLALSQALRVKAKSLLPFDIAKKV